MLQTYDAQADALYIEIGEGGGETAREVARTVEIDDDGHWTMVDLDADGNLLGIEVLSPGRPWPLAEILKRYEVSADDAAMLMAGYPCAISVMTSN